MNYLIYLFFFAFFAYVILKLIVEPEMDLRKKIKAAEEKKRKTASPSLKKNKDEDDFLGTELLKNNPKKFLQNVEQNREKLKRGEMIGVDAAQAFFLIRTASHNGMIVSEDGTINMKDLSDFTNINSNDEKLEELRREILEYQPKDRDMSQVKTFQVPGYVKEVVKVRGDIVRWVYHDWHANECGVKSICFDKHSRLVKDPDDENEDPKKTKSSSRKITNIRDEEQGGGSGSEIKDLSKKISRMIEMHQESRVDHMLSLSEEAKEVLQPENDLKNPDDVGTDGEEIKDEEELLDIQESNKPKARTSKSATLLDLKPTEYKDEVQQLEEELVSPNFLELMSDDYETRQIEEEFVAELEKDIAYAETQKKELEDEEIEFEYEGMETFLKEIAPREDFFEKVFEFITAEKENFGRILYDDAQRIVYIEKNFFSTCVGNCFSKKYKFERDFIQGDSIEIYDGRKIGKLIEAMNKRYVFSKTDSDDYIFKMLFMSEERENVCYKGWFIKVPIGGYEVMDDFVNYYSESISIISSTPREIERTSKRYTNVIISY